MSANFPQKTAIKLLPVGDTAWTVEFGERIDPAIHTKVRQLQLAIEALRQRALTELSSSVMLFRAITDVVPTFRSLTVHYQPLQVDGELLGEALRQLAITAGEPQSLAHEAHHWLLPVCFDADFAPDLADLAAAKGLSCEEVITRMLAAHFTVFMIGFMPGFPYMGGLPAALEMPRLTTPRKSLPARSLAIAGAMCAFYPWESPGGWRLLGRTPVPLFSAVDEQSPSLLAAGDTVRLRAITRADYVAMEEVFKQNPRVERRAFYTADQS